MSALTDFLHKLVDHVGVSSLHADIDALDQPESTEEATKDGEEDTTNAAE